LRSRSQSARFLQEPQSPNDRITQSPNYWSLVTASLEWRFGPRHLSLVTRHCFSSLFLWNGASARVHLSLATRHSSLLLVTVSRHCFFGMALRPSFTCHSALVIRHCFFGMAKNRRPPDFIGAGFGLSYRLSGSAPATGHYLPATSVLSRKFVEEFSSEGAT